jgi:hypothetical protein
VIHWDLEKCLAFRLHLGRRKKSWSIHGDVGEINRMCLRSVDEVEFPVRQRLFACGDEAGIILDTVGVIVG